MVKMTIDGQEVEVDPQMTVLQACEQEGIEIPRFCYHERLSIAGSCRMCLVEMERAPKPVASCSMPVGEGMVIHTNTEAVRKMRANVMEMLLLNHPLDCPICDQGGECDLQDQAMGYGLDRSNYFFEKRSVEDKYLGPLIGTAMTRCIQCTRCVRFITEVAGVEELGATGRGAQMEIGTYVEKALTSELSGNIIDLCPVGALTNASYAFAARSWELKKTESIDVLDALGTNIRIDSRGQEVMRIQPRLHEDVNEEWLGDKSRFSCDALRTQRLDTPYVRKDGKLEAVSWDEAFATIADNVKGVSGDAIAAIAGNLADCESMTVLKDLMSSLGSENIDCRQDGVKLDNKARVSYLFNSSIAGIEHASSCLIIGSNPRIEAPVLNARLRKRSRAGNFPVAMVGENPDLTFRYEHLGDSVAVLKEILAGKSKFSKVLKNSERPMLIIGQGALIREDGAAILDLARKIADKFGFINDVANWNGFNVLHTAAARVGGLDLGFVPGSQGKDVDAILEAAASGDMKVVYLLGADEIDTSKLDKAFVIYQGHHGEAGAHAADVILPGAAYTEKNATYVSTEGRVQKTRRAIYAPGEAREDWTIIRALSEALGKTLPFDDHQHVIARMVELNANFMNIDQVVPAKWEKFGHEGKMSTDALVSSVENYYMTDVISRTSAVMAECSDLFLNPQDEKTGTYG